MLGLFKRKKNELSVKSECDVIDLLGKAYLEHKQQRDFKPTFNMAVQIMSEHDGYPCYTDKYDRDSFRNYHNLPVPCFEVDQVVTRESLHELYDYVLLSMAYISQRPNHGIYHQRVMQAFNQMRSLAALFDSDVFEKLEHSGLLVVKVDAIEDDGVDFRMELQLATEEAA